MIKKILLFLLIFFSSNQLIANEKIYFIDIDYVFNNSNFGKKILKEIDTFNKKITDDLFLIENSIKKKDNEIRSTKSLMTEQVYIEKINDLKQDINDFNKSKTEMSKSYDEFKINKLSDFSKQINPIIQSYMKDKSIDVIIDKKSIYIGKSEFDLTKIITDIVNSKIK